VIDGAIRGAQVRLGRVGILGVLVCVTYIGIGVVVPLFPFFATRIGVPPEAITTAMAVVAIGQLVSTPFWGWVSDRVGRKPVIILTLVGSGVAWLMLGWAESIAMLMASRLVAGLMSGITAVAFAAVADSVEGPERPAIMGRIGAALSLGFILGAALGGLLAGSGEHTDYRGIAVGVAALDVLAAALAWVMFRETRSAAARAAARHERRQAVAPQRYAAIRRTLRDPMLRRLAAVNFAFAGSFAVVDSTLPLFAVSAHGFSPAQISYTFTLMGVVTTLTQGVLLRRLVAALGALDTVLLAVLALAVGHALVALSTSPWVVAVGCAALATSLGLFIAPASSLIAGCAGEHERGAILGVYQGAGNVGKVLTPLASGVLFVQVGASAPFIGAALLLVPIAVLLLATRASPAPKRH
jgi:MFS family permease